MPDEFDISQFENAGDEYELGGDLRGRGQLGKPPLLVRAQSKLFRGRLVGAGIINAFPGAYLYPNANFGYPYIGSPRRIKAKILGVCHITGNSNMPSALNEVIYSARQGSGASFTFALNRDGSAVQALDPATQTPWTNGDLNSPNLSNPIIAAISGSGYNANEYCDTTIEGVGYDGNFPWTPAQREIAAQIYAWRSRATGIAPSRNTIVGHKDLNSVTRFNCPQWTDGAALEQLLASIINRTIALLGGTAPQEDDVFADFDPRPASVVLKVGTQVMIGHPISGFLAPPLLASQNRRVGTPDSPAYTVFLADGSARGMFKASGDDRLRFYPDGSVESGEYFKVGSGGPTPDQTKTIFNEGVTAGSQAALTARRQN